MTRRCLGEKSSSDSPSMVLMARVGGGGARSKLCGLSEVKDCVGV